LDGILDQTFAIGLEELKEALKQMLELDPANGGARPEALQSRFFQGMGSIASLQLRRHEAPSMWSLMNQREAQQLAHGIAPSLLCNCPEASPALRELDRN
jgi:hypothetical protein